MVVDQSNELAREPIAHTGPNSNQPMTSDNERPVWLLDVDGVINGTGRAGWHQAPRAGRAFAGGVGYRIRWAPQLITEIRSLLSDVDVRWATTWIDVGMAQLEDLVGLPALPHAYPQDPSRRALPNGLQAAHITAKTRAALDLIASGRRLIWTDDEAIPTAGPSRDILDASGALLIAPDPRRGLREDHIQQIRAFVGHPAPQN